MNGDFGMGWRQSRPQFCQKYYEFSLLDFLDCVIELSYDSCVCIFHNQILHGVVLRRQLIRKAEDCIPMASPTRLSGTSRVFIGRSGVIIAHASRALLDVDVHVDRFGLDLFFAEGSSWLPEPKPSPFSFSFPMMPVSINLRTYLLRGMSPRSLSIRVMNVLGMESPTGNSFLHVINMVDFIMLICR